MIARILTGFIAAHQGTTIVSCVAVGVILAGVVINRMSARICPASE